MGTPAAAAPRRYHLRPSRRSRPRPTVGDAFPTSAPTSGIARRRSNGFNTAHCASVIDDDGYPRHCTGVEARSWTRHDTHAQASDNDTRTPGRAAGVDTTAPTRSSLQIDQTRRSYQPITCTHRAHLKPASFETRSEWTAHHRLPRLLVGELMTRGVRRRGCASCRTG